VQVGLLAWFAHETVFTAQLLKSMREDPVDIDSIAEHVHRTTTSVTSVPSKNDQPVEFIAPLVPELVKKLKALEPQKPKGPLRHVQTLEAQLKAGQDQLAAARISNSHESQELLGTESKKQESPFGQHAKKEGT
jgi:hypothetical protein